MENDSFLTKVVLFLNWILGFIYFRILNHTKAYNQKGLLKKTGILYLSSHYTMIDSWLIGTTFNPFWIILSSRYMPYNIPEQTNFFKGKFLNWWFSHSKCIPVVRGEKNDSKSTISKALQQTNVLLFPDTSRRKLPNQVHIKPAIGELISQVRPQLLIPIKLIGLPLGGNFWLGCFNRFEMIVGEPIIIKNLELANTKSEYLKIVQQVMDEIEKLHT